MRPCSTSPTRLDQPAGRSVPATATDMLGPHQQMIRLRRHRVFEGPQRSHSPNRQSDRDLAGGCLGVFRYQRGGPDHHPHGRARRAGRTGLSGEFRKTRVSTTKSSICAGCATIRGTVSNVAVQNMGSEGSITLRITAFSGNPTDPSGQVAWEDTLGPGEFHQANEVLKGVRQGRSHVRGLRQGGAGGGHGPVLRLRGHQRQRQLGRLLCLSGERRLA